MDSDELKVDSVPLQVSKKQKKSKKTRQADEFVPHRIGNMSIVDSVSKGKRGKAHVPNTDRQGCQTH
jgi:hypothetical protein